MAEFRSRDDLERWLLHKPPEFARLIAVQAALVVTPLLLLGRTTGDKPYGHMTLAALRAGSLTWSTDNGYARHKSVAAWDEVSRFASSTSAAFASAAYAAAATYTARAAAADTAGGIGTYSAYAADAYSTYAAVSRPSAFASDPVAVWKYLSAVASRLEKGETADAILKSPFDGPYKDEWRAGAAALLGEDPNWRFWTDWYEDRLAGRPLNPAFEQALLSLTESEWDCPVAEVNAQLMALQDAAEQKPAGRIFEFENGRQVARVYPFAFQAGSDLKSFAANVQTQIRNYLHDIKDEYGDSRFGRKLVRSLEQVLVHISLPQIDIGGILQSLAVLDANRLSMDSPDGNLNAPDDLKNDLDAIIANLFQLLALYGGDVANLKARAEALKLNTNDFDAIDAVLRKIVAALQARPDLIHETTITALQESIDRAAEISEIVAEREAAADHDGAVRAMVDRTMVQAQHILVQRNQFASLLEVTGKQVNDLGSAAKKGTLKGVERVAEATVIFAFFALIGQVHPQIAALSAFGVSAMKPLSGLGERLLKNAPPLDNPSGLTEV